MREQIVIRQFREDDLDQVIRINRRCLPENYSRLFFLELYKRSPSLFLVAEVEGRIVGYALCRIEFGFPEMGKIGFLTKKGHLVSIAVVGRYRRRGIGTELMKDAMKAMLEYDAKECYLEVRVSNKNAILMYEKLGFVARKRTPKYYRDGEDAFVMARSLPHNSEPTGPR